MPLNRVVILRNIDRQDRQDKQDEKLLHRKLTGSMIGSAFEAIQNLHYFRNVGATSCPFVDFLFFLVSFFVALHGPFSSLFQPLGVPSRINL